MKIISCCEVPNDRVYQATCNNCKSVLEFKRSEAMYTSDQRDGDFLRVVCPVCNFYVTKSI